LWQALAVASLVFVHPMPSGAQTQSRFALEAGAGPVWASHWSPRDKPPGTEVVVDWRPGRVISLSGTARLGRFVTAEVGLLLVDKGAHHTVATASFPFGDMELSYAFRYLELPITLRTYWVRIGPAALFTYGGAYVAFALDNSYTFYNAEKGSATRRLDDVVLVDVGFISGFGVERTLGRVSVIVKYRYSMGFVDLTLDTDPVYIPEFRGVEFPVIELRNYTHAVLVGVRWLIS